MQALAMARREHGLLAKVTECTVRGFKSAGCAGWLRECLWNAQDWCPEVPQESMRTLGHPRGLACGRSVGSEQRSRQQTFCLGSKRNEQWRRLNELQKKPWRCSCLCMCGRKILSGSKLDHTVWRHVDCLNVQLSDCFLNLKRYSWAVWHFRASVKSSRKTSKNAEICRNWKVVWPKGVIGMRATCWRRLTSSLSLRAQAHRSIASSFLVSTLLIPFQQWCSRNSQECGIQWIELHWSYCEILWDGIG